MMDQKAGVHYTVTKQVQFPGSSPNLFYVPKELYTFMLTILLATIKIYTADKNGVAQKGKL